LEDLGVDPKIIKGIFVSHFHADHAKYAGETSGRLHVPVFATSETIERGAEAIVARAETVETIYTGAALPFGAFRVLTVWTYHTPGAVGFAIEAGGKAVSIFSDVPDVTQRMDEAFAKSEFIAVECNHALELLRTCDYADSLKERIRLTHLSTEALAGYFRNRFNGGGVTKRIALIHLSARAQMSFLAEAAIRAAVARPEIEVFAVPLHEVSGPWEV
jgi:phosphoribosyl 1,2-cyclic phosphodiesterase